MFSTVKLQMIVWPSVAARPGQSFSAHAPVPGSWARAGLDTTSVPTPATRPSVRASRRAAETLMRSSSIRLSSRVCPG